MPSFLTQCPHCLTSFRVTDAQLDAAEGLVRCGACLGIFSAAANRITLKQTPDELSATDAATDVDALAFDDGESDDQEAGEPGSQFVPELADDDEFYEALDESRAEDDLQENSDFDVEVASEPSTATAATQPSPPNTKDKQHDATASHLVDPEDFDIPLGDFNLDGHLEPGDEDEHEEFEVDDEDDDEDESGLDEEEYDDEDQDDDDYEDDDDEEDEDDSSFDEDDDADEPDQAESVYEEYTDEVRSEILAVEEEDPQPEEFEPEFQFEDDDEEFLDEADEALADEEFAVEENDELAEAPATAPQRSQLERIGPDKTELRHYLAQIEDDDALGPIDDDAALAAINEPVMLNTAPRRSWIAGFALVTANLVLAALLLLQLADANIERLGRNARLSGLMPYVCRVLDCPAPDRSQVELFVTEQLLVRSHPRFAQALEVSLVFRNDAAVAQPFPALELGFSDSGNRLLANRLFAPSEYLPPELRTSDMPAQSSMQVSLELEDPGSEAVNYTLDFRKPE